MDCHDRHDCNGNCNTYLPPSARLLHRSVLYRTFSRASRHRATLHLVLVEEQITPDSPIPILCRLRQSADRLALYPFRLIAIRTQYGYHHRSMVQYAFIIAGIYTMIRKHYLSGGVLLLAGLYLLGSKLMLFPGNFQAMLWPLALILIGIFFLRHHHRRNWTHQRTVHRRAKMVQRMMNKRMGEQEEQQCQSDDGFLYSNNSLSAVRHVVLDELFKGANIRTYFGGTTIDLRHTNIAPGETYIDLDCSWGRVELYIPADWQVRIECSCFCGGCEDKRWQGTPAKQEWCVLMIRGNISFGGLEIKIKRWKHTR